MVRQVWQGVGAAAPGPYVGFVGRTATVIGLRTEVDLVLSVAAPVGLERPPPAPSW